MNTINTTHEAEIEKTGFSLSDKDRKSIDVNGYFRIDNALSPAQVVAMRTRLQEIVDIEGDDAGLEVHTEVGTDRLGDLVNKDPMFDICFSHPRVLGTVRHMLGNDIRLSALNSRTALPGYGRHGLHADSGSKVQPGEYEKAMSIWLLCDFTEDNGPTRVVPGSHSWGKLAAEEMDDPNLDHPDQICLTGKAGTCFVFNAHIWHGGTMNNSEEKRPAIFAFFGRRDVSQSIDQKKYMRPETYERLDATARHMLDVEGMTEFSPADFDRRSDQYKRLNKDSAY